MDYPASPTHTPSALDSINLIGHCPFCLKLLEKDPTLKRSTNTGKAATNSVDGEVIHPDSEEQPLSAFYHIWPHLFRRYQNCIHLAENEDITPLSLSKFTFVSKFQNGKEDTTDITTVDVPPVCSGCQDLLRQIQKTHKELYELREKLNDHVNRLRVIICGAFDGHAAFEKLLRSQTSMDKTEVTSTLKFLRCLTEVKSIVKDIRIEVKPEPKSPLSSVEDEDFNEGGNELEREAHLKTERMSEEEASSDNDRDSESGDDDPDFSLDEEEMMEMESNSDEEEDEKQQQKDPLQLSSSPKKLGRKQGFKSIVADKDSSFEEIKSDSPLPTSPSQSPPPCKKAKIDFCAFKCDLCPEQSNFKFESRLMKHKLEEHGVDPYICPVPNCNKILFSKLAHYMHIKQQHPEENPELPKYECEQCERIFSDCRNLNRHYIEVHLNQGKPKRVYVRRKLPKTETTESAVKSMKNAPSLKPVKFKESDETEGKELAVSLFKCENCSKSFINQTRLNKHVKLDHSKIKCKYCERTFINHNRRRTHYLEDHTDVRSYKCDLCSQSFETKNKKIEHQVVAHGIRRWKCDTCPRDYPTFGKLKTHKKDVHGETLKKIYECDFPGCAASFPYRRDRNAHNREHFPPKPPPPVEKQVQVRTFECEECSIKFPAQRYYTFHMKKVHQSVGLNRTHVCDECGETFDREYTLKKHKDKRHNPNLETLKCEYCGVDCRHKDALKSHIKIVHKKEFSCEVCGKRFGRKQFLDFHFTVHTGERPFACHLCPDKRFRRPGQLKKHLGVHARGGWLRKNPKPPANQSDSK